MELFRFLRGEFIRMKNDNKLTLDELENWVDEDSVGYVLGGEDEFTFESPDGKEISVTWMEQDDNDYGDINILLDSDPVGFLNTSIDDAYNRNSIDFNDQDLISQRSKEISAKIASCVNHKIIDTYSYLLK